MFSVFRSVSSFTCLCIPKQTVYSCWTTLARNYSTKKDDFIKFPFDGKKDAHALRYTRPKVKFIAQGVDLDKYTHHPIPYPKTGGRDWKGMVMNKRIGGGSRQCYRMVDFTRNAIDENTPLEERVLTVRYDPLRSADIALVANNKNKRWILASAKMKKGDIIRSHAAIPKLPVSPKEGDAHPIAALPLGTVIHNIEISPKLGGTVARAAGSSGIYVRKQGDACVVKMPSGNEMLVDENCVATVGKVSNDDTDKTIGSAKRNRWFGVRPSSGLRQKKTGYHGRRIKPPKPIVVYSSKAEKLHEMFDT